LFQLKYLRFQAVEEQESNSCPTDEFILCGPIETNITHTYYSHLVLALLHTRITRT